MADEIPFGRIRSVDELGKLVRVHRKSKGLTLETVAGIGNLSPRFLSEFERGKPTCELGKVLRALQILGLELIIRPRSGYPGSEATAGRADDGQETL